MALMSLGRPPRAFQRRSAQYTAAMTPRAIISP
jgi:hypothetical protein